MDVKEFGKYLRGLRKEKSLSTHKLAGLSGVSQSYISHLESGRKSGFPSPDILKKIATALGVPHIILMNNAGHVDNTGISRSLDAGHTLLRLFAGALLINEELIAEGELSEILRDELVKLSVKHGYPEITLFFSAIKDKISQLESKKDEIDQYEAFYQKNKEFFQDLEAMICLAREIRIKRTEQNDLLKLLHQQDTINYNGHQLTDQDRQRVATLLKVLFPEYQ
jgi:transcriptional regulator with XRE-family HTH domain